MKNKIVLVSDYDHTLNQNENNLINIIDKIKHFRELGNIFIIATGRSYDDFYRVVNEYHIPFDYAILNHGGTIIDSNNQVLYYNFFPRKYNELLINDLNLSASEKYFCCSILKSRVDFNYGDLTKVYVKYFNREESIKVTSLINQRYHDELICYHVGERSLEVVSKLSDKAYGIEFLINKLDFDKENVYTIGDGFTDIEMVKKYHGYAMNNSVKELLNVTSNHINSVNILIDQLLNL